jgi:hypothetical protein
MTFLHEISMRQFQVRFNHFHTIKPVDQALITLRWPFWHAVQLYDAIVGGAETFSRSLQSKIPRVSPLMQVNGCNMNIFLQDEIVIKCVSK